MKKAGRKALARSLEVVAVAAEIAAVGLTHTNRVASAGIAKATAILAKRAAEAIRDQR